MKFSQSGCEQGLINRGGAGRELAWVQGASTTPSVKLYRKQFPAQPDLNRTTSTFDMKLKAWGRYGHHFFLTFNQSGELFGYRYLGHCTKRGMYLRR